MFQKIEHLPSSNRFGSVRGVGSAKSRQALHGLPRSGDAELQLSVRRPPSTPLRQRPEQTFMWRVSDQLPSTQQ